jgi:uncharacterized membrane protein
MAIPAPKGTSERESMSVLATDASPATLRRRAEKRGIESEKGWRQVERIYLALTRLASITLVGGLIIVMMLALNSGRLYPDTLGGDFSPSFIERLWYAAPGLLATGVSFLMDGVALLGIVVAWAERQRSWTLALATAVVVAVIFPFALMLGGNFFAIHPRIAQLMGNYATLLIYLLSLVPVALALVMARQGGGERATERERADAALEITRSRL